MTEDQISDCLEWGRPANRGPYGNANLLFTEFWSQRKHTDKNPNALAGRILSFDGGAAWQTRSIFPHKKFPDGNLMDAFW